MRLVIGCVFKAAREIAVACAEDAAQIQKPVVLDIPSDQRFIAVKKVLGCFCADQRVGRILSAFESGRRILDERLCIDAK